MKITRANVKAVNSNSLTEKNTIGEIMPCVDAALPHPKSLKSFGMHY